MIACDTDAETYSTTIPIFKSCLPAFYTLAIPMSYYTFEMFFITCLFSLILKRNRLLIFLAVYEISACA